MSATRLGRNWADVDEEDDEDVIVDNSSRGARCFETAADEHGIKTVIEYKERDGKTYKVTRRVKLTTVTKWSNPEMTTRKSMDKFGVAKANGPTLEAQHCIRCVEEVPIDICRKAIVMSQANEAEDKFYEEALKGVEGLFKEKKVWTSATVDRDGDAPAAAAAAAPDAPAAAAPTGGPAKYVPPSVRAAQSGGGKGDGKGKDGKGDPGTDASLRITNLSEEAKEGDLQELFGQFGRLQRVYMSKDPDTGLGKGFAFVTYYTKEDAQKAINKLNGHGYDNLILQVQIARPRA